MQKKESYSDEELAIRTQQGGLADFEELAKRYWPKLHRFLLTYGNDAFASDMTQETLHRAYRKISYYNSKKSFTPWVFTIARNLAMNSLQKSKRKAEVVMNEIMGESTPDENNEHELGVVWNKAKEILSPSAFRSLRLHYGEEITVKEVAIIMGKNKVAIKVILHRSRKKLAEYFKINPINL